MPARPALTRHRRAMIRRGRRPWSKYTGWSTKRVGLSQQVKNKKNMIRIIYRKSDKQALYALEVSQGVSYFNEALYAALECEEDTISQELEAQGVKGIVTGADTGRLEIIEG